MTEREIMLKTIKKEADKFFDYPTADQSHVSTYSMILFVEHMLNSSLINKKNKKGYLHEKTSPLKIKL